MLQIAICDDEPLSLTNIESETRSCLEKQHIFPMISAFTSGTHLLYALEDGAFFDLLLLDIEIIFKTVKILFMKESTEGFGTEDAAAMSEGYKAGKEE